LLLNLAKLRDINPTCNKNRMAAATPTWPRSVPPLPIAGSPLSPSEVDAVVSKARAQLRSLTPEQIAQLKQSLSATPADVFRAAAQAAGVGQSGAGDVMTAASAPASAAELVWSVVEKGLLLGSTSSTANATISTPSGEQTAAAAAAAAA
jgi:hypothetical protein